MKQWIWGAAMGFALVACAAEAQEGAFYSYCSTYSGAGTGRKAYYTRVMPERVYRTMNSYARDYEYRGPNTESDMKTRLQNDFARAGIETHYQNGHCDVWPRRELADRYRAESIEKWIADGVPVFEFDYRVAGMPVGNFTPVTARPTRKASPAPSVPSAGSGLIVTGPSPEERAAQLAEDDRREAERLEAKRRETQRKAEAARRLAEAKAAFAAWKNRPKAPPCGGDTGRACGASRQ